MRLAIRVARNSILVLCLVIGITIPLIIDLSQPKAHYMAGLMVIIAAVLTFWSAGLTRKVADESNVREHYREVQRDFRNRFSEIAKLLSGTSFPGRLAAVYSLAALADDWQRHGQDVGDSRLGFSERQVCINLLCAYIRSANLIASNREREVRDAAIGVIREKVRIKKAPDFWGEWSLHKFDLAGADLEGADFSRCAFSAFNLDLSGTNSDDANFSRSVLKGASFSRATIDRAKFIGADLTGADFSGVDLSKADMREATQVDLIN